MQQKNELRNAPVAVATPAAEAAKAVKKAEPLPGAADYDWSQHYPADVERYRHTFDDGTVVELKSFGAIYSKTWLYKMRNVETDAEMEFAALDRAASPEAIAVLERLDDSGEVDPINELWQAWIAAGTSRGEGDKGLTPGK